MYQVWKGLSNLDPRDSGGFYKKPLLSDQGGGGPRDPKFVFRSFYHFRFRFFHRYFFLIV